MAPHRAPWPSPVLLLVAVLAVFARTAACAVVEHNFNITWLWANPDGNHARPVISINGQWPPPQLHAAVGDTLVINTWNSLGNQSTSLHFHGIYMNTTANMDGTSGVSQCSIRPGESFTYRFNVNQPGTYWYHSHTTSQYPDGLRGMLVIADPKSPYASEFTQEISISVSDWHYDDIATLLAEYDSHGSDPVPDAIIINDVAKASVPVKPGTTYLVHVANIAAYAGIYFWIEDHVMRVVEADGVWTQQAEARSIYLAAGQRHSFLLTTKDDAVANFPMVAQMDPELLYDESRQAVGWLTYNEDSPMPEAKKVEQVTALDDMDLVPYDQQTVLTDVGQSITLEIGMGMSMGHGSHYWQFNSTRYETPDLPSLFSALDHDANVTDPELYGHNSHPLVLDHNVVTEIVVINRHMMDHPIHLHGHSFQILRRTRMDENIWDEPDLSATPVRRDTVLVRSGGSARIRFRSDNPGVWLFHCHMEWHAHSGLVVTIIEAPLEIQRQGLITQLPVGTDSKRVCSAQDIRPAQEYHEIVAGSSSTGPAVYTSPSIASGVVGLVLIVAAGAGTAWYIRRRRSRPADTGEKHEYELVKPEEDEEEERR